MELRGIDVEEVSLPSRGAWIEIFTLSIHFCHFTSLPSRGAWIEINLLTVRKF